MISTLSHDGITIRDVRATGGGLPVHIRAPHVGTVTVEDSVNTEVEKY